MKIFKLLLPLCMSASLGTGLMASENESLLSSMTHKPYVAYEISQCGPTLPSIGYRGQLKNFIVDVSIGYKYLGFYKEKRHLNDLSASILYSFFKNDKSQSYAGIGLTKRMVFCKSKRYSTEHSTLPALTSGYQFKVSEKNDIFLEFVYKPVVFSSSKMTTIHEDVFKVGITY